MQLTKKAFQEHLNQEDRKAKALGNGLWKNGSRRGQRVRLYGDYLRQADPEMFEIEYEQWVKAKEGK